MSDQAVVSSIVTEALDCFKSWSAIEDKQRNREIEDLQFQVPELQWPKAVADTRTAMVDKATGVTLAARPMLSIPKLDQPIQLVLNQEKAAHLGVQVHPLSEDADDETAEILQGLYRAIEVDSRANLARSWAFERAVKAGRGFYRILKEYDETSDHPSDQKIVMKRIYEQGSVYLDPSATEPDGSDAEKGLIVADIPLRTYKRLYPKSVMASYSDEEFVALGNERPGWVTGEGEGRAIRVAEYFYVEYEDETLEWKGADGQSSSRPRQKRIVKWCKLNAAEELDTGIWDGRYIPIIRVVGRELIPFDGEKRCVGIIGQNKDAQRLFNYAASASVEMAALETKASHALDPRQVQGYEAWWNQKNLRNFPWLPYTRMIDGVDLGQPVPIQADMSKMQVNALLLQQAGDFIHAGTGAYEPTLGDQSKNVKSGRQALALQQQHEQGNSNWLDNLAEISMTHEARVVLDLIPFVYDRPGRVARILDLEDKPKAVMFNAPYRMEKNRPQGLAQMPAGQALPPDVKHYDLTKGRYGVTVSVGKAYKSRVEQGKDELGQLFAAAPEMFPILGDIYFKFADFPGHREAAERMKKMLPPPLQDQDGQQDAKLQLDQAKAAMQQMQQQLQEMAKALETDKVKVDGDIQKTKINAELQVQLQTMKDATAIRVKEIEAEIKGVLISHEAEHEAAALGIEHAHEATQAEADRQHERDMAERAAANAAQMAEAGATVDLADAAAGRQHDVTMSEQGHQQALEQGDQGIQGQLAVTKAKPQPSAGE